MGRIRTIKPEAPQSESLGRCCRDARLLFFMLFTVADDEGRGRAASRLLASLLFPYDEDAPLKIPEWLMELEREGRIKVYANDDNTYFQIANWTEHQKIDKPTKSKHPAPPEKKKPRERAPRPREQSRVVGDGSPLDQGGDGIKDQGVEGRLPPPPKISFEEFYQKYPVIKIQSKPKAEAEWNALDEAEQRKAFEALPGLKAYCASDKTYPVLHAWTFLGERRYLGFAGSGVDPAKTAALKDRADQIMQRGIYAPKDAAE